MKPKKIPLRMCVGCMQMRPKAELIRIVKETSGDISLDPSGKKNGRGAYICKNEKCLENAIRTKKLQRTFNTVIPDEVFTFLQGEMSSIE